MKKTTPPKKEKKEKKSFMLKLHINLLDSMELKSYKFPKLFFKKITSRLYAYIFQFINNLVQKVKEIYGIEEK
jgi:hypothetical protein